MDLLGLVGIIISAFGGGAVATFMNRKKVQSETDLNEVEIAHRLIQEQKDWYDFRIAELEADVKALKLELQQLKLMIPGEHRG